MAITITAIEKYVDNMLQFATFSNVSNVIHGEISILGLTVIGKSKEEVTESLIILITRQLYDSLNRRNKWIKKI